MCQNTSTINSILNDFIEFINIYEKGNYKSNDI